MRSEKTCFLRAYIMKLELCAAIYIYTFITKLLIQIFRDCRDNSSKPNRREIEASIECLEIKGGTTPSSEALR